MLDHRCRIRQDRSCFTNLPLGLENGCYDKVVLRCDNEYGPKIGKYCGGDEIDDVYSSGRKMYVRFTSDSWINSYGFAIYYEAVSSDSHSASCDSNTSGGVIVGLVVGIIVGIIILIVVAVVIIIVCNMKKNAGRVHSSGIVTTTTHTNVPMVSTTNVTVTSSNQQGLRPFIPVAQPYQSFGYAAPNTSYAFNMNQPVAQPPTYSQSVEQQFHSPKQQNPALYDPTVPPSGSYPA